MSGDAAREILLTPEGLQKLEGELNHLKTVRRKEVAERIKAARDFGDLSENSEYDDAKNEQAFIEKRIAQIEQMLRNARIVTDDDVEPDLIHIGSVVRVRDLEDGDEYTYYVVGSNEGDPSSGKISYESPVGKALLGRRAGEQVEVKTPGGHKRVLEILEVSKRSVSD